MKKNKVSIIIPVYNTEKYLERCLQSVLNQTLKEIEIIIIIDESPDNSVDICKKYKKIDERITYYVKKNEGLGLTRNYGQQRATGEYIAFLDSDDFVDLDFYEKLYNEAKIKKADISVAEFKYYESNNKIYQTDVCKLSNKEFKNPKDYLYSMLGEEGYPKIGMSVWKCLYKNDFINKNNIVFLSEREYGVEDICYNFEAFELATYAVSVYNTYYYYCFNDASLSHSYRADRFEKTKKLYIKMNELAKKYDERKETLNAIDTFYIEFVRGIINKEVEHGKNAYHSIKHIINDLTVKKAIKNHPTKKKIDKVVIRLIKFKLTFLLIFVYKMRGIIK